MKERANIKTINSILSICGLALLLLLSPCKVRNFIQAELGAPQTNVLNKSQSTISLSNCQTLEISETIQTISKPTFPQPGVLLQVRNHFDLATHPLGQSFNFDPSKRQAHADIPLYILYQKLTVYS